MIERLGWVPTGAQGLPRPIGGAAHRAYRWRTGRAGGRPTGGVGGPEVPHTAHRHVASEEAVSRWPAVHNAGNVAG